MNQKFLLKVGLFGIGLDAYWEQFEGLKAKLESYVEIVSGKIQAYNVELYYLLCSGQKCL